MLTPNDIISNTLYTCPKTENLIIGLGTGNAADKITRAFAESSWKKSCKFVPTSERTRALADKLDLHLISYDYTYNIDYTFDGADEVYLYNKQFIKGYGGALFLEKLIHFSSKTVVIVAGKEKIVPYLGYKERLPIEISPLSYKYLKNTISDFPINLRTEITDHGNFIIDGHIKSIASPTSLDTKLNKLPGVIVTGLFSSCLSYGENESPEYKVAILEDKDYPEII